MCWTRQKQMLVFNYSSRWKTICVQTKINMKFYCNFLNFKNFSSSIQLFVQENSIKKSAENLLGVNSLIWCNLERGKSFKTWCIQRTKRLFTFLIIIWKPWRNVEGKAILFLKVILNWFCVSKNIFFSISIVKLNSLGAKKKK